ncbi:MAG: hypothetical protein ACFE8J_02035 [Candidatus Heimdallarchaeota archaeon]
MKKLNAKSLMIITLFLASFTATPMMVAGYSDEANIQLPLPIPGGMDLIGGFEEGFGSALGGLGYGGNLLARVFLMLFLQGLFNLSESEILPGVYVLSAFTQESYAGNSSFSGAPEYYYIPYDYYEAEASISGFPYVKVVRQGGYDYNLTIGAGVTLVIWDNDNSFINAVKRIIDFFHKFRNLEQLGTFEDKNFLNSPEFQALIREGVELITWFLIHINDIFTGEELFALNPITWQNLDIRPWNTDDGDPANYSISKELHETGSDWNIDGGDAIISNPAMVSNWQSIAAARSDDYLTWLLTPTDDADLVRTIWTTFTFDLIQLWIKNFEIHINVAEIMNLIGGANGGALDIAAIFQGLDIEFYLFTHHLAGAFLYNDSIVDDDKITTEYVRVNNSIGDPVLVNGEEIHIPKTSEVTHRLILNSVNQFNFIEPYVSGETVKWGIRLVDTKITPVPIGVDLDNYLGAAQEDLGYIQFGFTFEPKKVQIPDENGRQVPVLQGAIKLYQEFAPWNDPNAHYSNNAIGDLDMAIIYLSSMLHFHLNVQTIGEEPDDPTTFLDPSQDYNDQTHELKIGNYLGDKFSGQLDFIDIAGPSYEYGDEDSKATAPASTAIIPLALYESEIERHDTFVDEDDNIEFETFATDIQLNISFNVLGYAVCYPEFEDGTGIWHDPTFTVYMVFEATGFWALILLIAGVGLVGVATVLIKRRKDARF